MRLVPRLGAIYKMNNIQKHLMNILYSGHRHQEISNAVKCYECGTKMKKWESEHNRLRQLYPQEFIRKEFDYAPGKQVTKNIELLEDRLKKDSDYRREVQKKFKIHA